MLIVFTLVCGCSFFLISGWQRIFICKLRKKRIVWNDSRSMKKDEMLFWLEAIQSNISKIKRHHKLTSMWTSQVFCSTPTRLHFQSRTKNVDDNWNKTILRSAKICWPKAFSEWIRRVNKFVSFQFKCNSLPATIQRSRDSFCWGLYLTELCKLLLTLQWIWIWCKCSSAIPLFNSKDNLFPKELQCHRMYSLLGRNSINRNLFWTVFLRHFHRNY